MAQKAKKRVTGDETLMTPFAFAIGAARISASQRPAMARPTAPARHAWDRNFEAISTGM
jgi:hypothetical protein